MGCKRCPGSHRGIPVSASDRKALQTASVQMARRRPPGRPLDCGDKSFKRRPPRTATGRRWGVSRPGLTEPGNLQFLLPAGSFSTIPSFPELQRPMTQSAEVPTLESLSDVLCKAVRLGPGIRYKVPASRALFLYMGGARASFDLTQNRKPRGHRIPPMPPPPCAPRGTGLLLFSVVVRTGAPRRRSRR